MNHIARHLLIAQGSLGARNFAFSDEGLRAAWQAVPEVMGIKHAVIEEIEGLVPEHCVIATNTSALSVAEIASKSKRPENIVGMHYFSPVEKMPLLEVIRHAGTSDATAAAAVDVGIRQGKTVIVVQDVAGFYVNRCLGPFMAEGLTLVCEGAGFKDMDKAMKAYGMPVGPITLIDEVGVATASHVSETLRGALGVRAGAHPAAEPLLAAMIEANALGRMSGQGFYKDYATQKKAPYPENPETVELIKKLAGEPDAEAAAAIGAEEIQQRMMGRFVNEAVYCLQDGVIESALDGDIGAVFGIGFPHFRGGPFRLVDAIGPRAFCDQLLSLADKHGEQFAPAPLLVDHAKENKPFHPSA